MTGRVPLIDGPRDGATELCSTITLVYPRIGSDPTAFHVYQLQRHQVHGLVYMYAGVQSFEEVTK